MARYKNENLWITIRLIEICLILTTTYGCNIVSVKFSIGIFDEDGTYQHNNSNFSVALQYRSGNNDEWITEWNTTNMTVSNNASAENIELNLNSPSSLQLQWLQHRLSYAPELFINDIIIKGIVSDDGSKNKQKANCKLDKVIDFSADGLSYLLCNSEAKVNEYGLIFGGQMSKQVTLCTFNLASGNCGGSKDKCMSSSEAFPNMPSSTTSSSIKILTVTALPVSTAKIPGLSMNTVTSNNVTIIPNSTTSTITAMSSSTSQHSTTPVIITPGFTSSNKFTSQSSRMFVSISMEPPSTTKRPSVVSPSNTIVSLLPGPTSTTLSASLSVQSSATLPLSLTSIPFNSDITSSSFTLTQIYDRLTTTNSPLPSVTSWSGLQLSNSKPVLSTGTSSLSPSSTLMNTINEISVSVLSIKSTESLPTSVSVLVPTNTIMTGDNVVPSNTIQPTVSVTTKIDVTENCVEETSKIVGGKTQPVNSTRRLFCSNTDSFVKQVCNKSSATDEPAWHPDIPNTCENGLPISEKLYLMAVAEDTTTDEPIQYLINPMEDMEILDGDAILLSDLLVKLKGCADNVEEVQALSVLLDSQYSSTVEQLDESKHLLFVNNIYIAAEFYGFTCYNQTFSLTATSISFIVIRINLNEPIINDTIISHNDSLSFVLPRSVLAAAKNENHSYFQAVSYQFAGLENILPGSLCDYDSQYEDCVQYQLGSPVLSLSISCTSANCTNAIKEDGVQITIVHTFQINQESDAVCAFWNYSDLNKYTPFWSTQGCEVKERNVNMTVCVCNHLTHFGILFDATGRSSTKISSENEVALNVITYVGVSLSLLALILTIISMIMFRSKWDLRIFVHINLCSTLFIAQLIFIIAVDKTSNKVTCATVAILLHYFFIVSFMWMLMEGVVLYIMLVNVFNFRLIGRRYYGGFVLLCYGGPLVYMALCIPLGLVRRSEWSYGSDTYCWLTYKDNFIWAFIAPVLLILLVNIGILVISLKIMRRHLSDKRKRKRIWYWFRGSLSLIVIMGINWILGLLVLHEYLLPLIYLFAITTALQGVWIFLLFTVGSRQMREDYSKVFTSLHNTLSRSTVSNNSKISPLDVVAENNGKSSCQLQEAKNSYQMHETS